MNDNRKILITSFACGFALLAFVLNRVLMIAFEALRWPVFRVAGVFPVTAIMAVIISGGVIFWLFNRANVNAFLMDVIVEIKKVIWPVRKEVVGSTVVVIIAVLIASVILGVFDYIWTILIQKLLSTS